MSKFKYGLKNAYYSKITETDGVITYGTPKALKGAVSVSLSPVGESIEAYADDSLYYGEEVNNGYDGTLELYLISEDFKKDILGETANEDGVAEENAVATQNSFALLFETTLDDGARKFAFYNCRASRPNIESSTKTATKELGTETLNLMCRPAQDGVVKRYTLPTTDTSIVSAWYDAVYQPTATI